MIFVVACAAPSPADSGPLEWSYPLDTTLRVTHGQALGTHNSYHLRDDPMVTEEWDYAHLPLDEQAGSQGVRQFELDVHLEAGEFRVYHAIGFDDATTCDLLSDCLAVLRGWSQSNPAHFPLMVLVEPKDDAGGEEIDLSLLDEAVVAGWSDSFTPAELQGDASTLLEAATLHGWPTLDRLRGRAIFALLDSAEHRDRYTGEGRPMFALGRALDDPGAAFFLMDDPVADDIATAVSMGFLVRTRMDSETVAAAAASGGQWLSTDFPDEHALAEGSPVACNPVTAPAECTSAALEDPAFVSPPGT